MLFTQQDYSPQLEDFQYFVVIDFEATCDKGKKNNLYPQEIIEFPSVLVNAVTGELQAYFQTYVKPIYHPKLTDFCKELTGIQQEQVDNGVSLRAALELHDKSLQDMGIKDTKFAVVTWSNWDCQVMLENECKLKWIEKPDYFNRWINLRVPFSDVFGSSRCKLKNAVEMAGLVWEGRQHCGLHDAINTACLLVQLLKRGYKFHITNSLVSTHEQQKQHSPVSTLQQQKQHSPVSTLQQQKQPSPESTLKQHSPESTLKQNSLVSTLQHQKQHSPVSTLQQHSPVSTLQQHSPEPTLQQQKQYSPPNYQHYFPMQQQQPLTLDYYQHYYLQQECPPVYYPWLYQSLPNHHEAACDLTNMYTTYLISCEEQLKNGQDCFKGPVSIPTHGTGVYLIG